jgi:hypothetical protein
MVLSKFSADFAWGETIMFQSCLREIFCSSLSVEIMELLSSYKSEFSPCEIRILTSWCQMEEDS